MFKQRCCKQCRYVMFKGTMTKWPVQKLAQGTTKISDSYIIIGATSESCEYCWKKENRVYIIYNLTKFCSKN